MGAVPPCPHCAPFCAELLLVYLYDTACYVADCAHAPAMLLVDASGQYSWLMATSGHCVLDARLSSVTACWLMAIWMNVAHAVAAHWPHGQCQ